MICARTRSAIILAALLTFFILPPDRGLCNNPVSARYMQASGNRIVVELDISATPPPLVIVVQKLPVGSEVTDSSPKVKKYNPNKGVAKWLLRDVQPGKMHITMQLKNSLKNGSVSGEIRWRDRSGKMISIAIGK